MVTCLPGTTIEAKLVEKDLAALYFNNIFAGGGLILSQVAQLTHLETHVIQNWVKRGFLTSPQKKLYSKEQVCRIVTINMLRESLQLDAICGLISHVNGRLNDDSDNLLLDSELYNYYVNLLVVITDERDLAQSINEVLSDYNEPHKGAKKRIAQVLEIMYYAHHASILRQKAELMLKVIKN